MRKKAFFRLLAETIKKRIVAAFVCPILMLVHIITTLQRSLRRLCFHRCLCVHGGGVCFRGVCIREGFASRGVCIQRGLHPGGLHPRAVCIGGGHLHAGGLQLGASASGGSASRGIWADYAPSPNRIQQDTVNERAVRILLECILVIFVSIS